MTRRKSDPSTKSHPSNTPHERALTYGLINNLGNLDAKTARLLEDYFTEWLAPPGLILAFNCLIGRTTELRATAKYWERDDLPSFDEISRDVDQLYPKRLLTNRYAGANLDTMITDRCYEITIGDRAFVEAESLAGTHFKAPRDATGESPVDEAATGRFLRRQRTIDGREVQVMALVLAPLDLVGRDPQALARMLIAGMRILLGQCYAVFTAEQDRYEPLWSRLGNVTQESLVATLAALQDDLASFLGSLRLPGDSALRAILRSLLTDRDVAFRNNDQGGVAEAKSRAWATLSTSNAARTELLQAVRARIRDHSYRPERALLELCQNADDAAGQSGAAPSRGHGVVLEQRSEGLRFIHWGRPINEASADPRIAEERGYGRDLANMLRLNLSEKVSGEVGRFGLGFKCVHLITAEPRIASGLLALRIRHGMLPEDWPEGARLSQQWRDEGTGQTATVIDLPSTTDLGDPPQKEALDGLQRAAAWLPFTARHLRWVEFINNGAVTLAARATRTPLRGLPGASIVVRYINNTRETPALALDLSEGFEILLRIDSSGPASLQKDAPRLWHVLPLDDQISVDWLMNGPFPVDASRGRMTLAEGERHALFERLGTALGEKLIGLFDLAADDWSVISSTLSLERQDHDGHIAFWTALFHVFARDLDDPLAKAMHGPDRGLGHLLARRPAIPTGLLGSVRGLAGFDEKTKAIAGMLAEPEVFQHVTGWPSLTRLAQHIVTADVADVLAKLGLQRPRDVRLADVVRVEARATSPLSPTDATRLGVILNDQLRKNRNPYEELADVARAAAELRFQAADNSVRAPKDLSLPPEIAQSLGMDRAEEALQAAFASDRELLASSYSGAFALECFLFARSGSGYGPRAQEMAARARAASSQATRTAALRYLLRGVQRDPVAVELRRILPDWLPAPVTDLRGSPLVAAFEPREVEFLLLYLGAQSTSPEPAEPTKPIADASKVLKDIHDWWTDVREKELRDFEGGDRGLYPDFFNPANLQSDAPDEAGRVAWFTLFALAAIHTLGRTVAGQHRNFFTMAERSGWWRELALSHPPNDPDPWIKRLNAWSEADLQSAPYRPWRNLLPDLYAFARWLDDYRDMFLALPGLIAQERVLSFSGLLKPSAYAALAPMGLDAAAVDRAIGIGAPFIVRELTRKNIIAPPERLAPYCWVPTQRVRELLSSLGCRSTESAGFADMSADIHRFVVDAIGPE